MSGDTPKMSGDAPKMSGDTPKMSGDAPKMSGDAPKMFLGVLKGEGKTVTDIFFLRIISFSSKQNGTLAPIYKISLLI
jgi:hypothetical protein